MEINGNLEIKTETAPTNTQNKSKSNDDVKMVHYALLSK